MGCDPHDEPPRLLLLASRPASMCRALSSAVISGTSGVGQPLEFDKDVELISSNQLHDKRWICRFSIFSAAMFPIASR